MTDTQISIGSTRPSRNTSLLGVERVKDRHVIRWLFCALSLVGDLGVIFAAAIVTEWYYFGSSDFDNSPRLAYVVVSTYLLADLTLGAYRLAALRSASASVWSALLSLATAAGLSLLAALAFEATSSFWQQETLLFLGLAAVGLVILRWILAAGLLRNDEKIEPRVVLLGDESVRANRDRKVAATINVRAGDWRPAETDPNFLNDLSVAVAGADRIVLSFRAIEERREWVRLLGQIGLETELLEPNMADLKPLALRYFNSTPTLVVSTEPLTFGKRALKRAFDLMLVLLTAPVVVPLVGVLAILIHLDSPGPVFFVQKRIGTNNRYFNCIKFRTMRADLADAAGNHLTERNDHRVTRLGHFLRHTSLDELPQLWNVLTGEMSLIGPRPHALGARADGALYWDVVPAYWQRHSMKPGLTGLAQIRGYRGPTEKRSDIENRVAADLEYIRTWSLWLDVKILSGTLRVLIHHNAL